ncbi:MAG: STAS domain-containing protein, partial [Myxococcota bacterium]
MSDKFSAKLRSGSEYTFVQIQGVIDEDNQLGSLTKSVTTQDNHNKVLIIDLGDVSRINSCGVRDWVNWLTDVQHDGRDVVLIRCSPAIVGQANMVTNFCGDAIIHSFFAPYFIPSTEMSVDKLLYVSQFPEQGPIRAPNFVSEETGEPMEFDDFEESYFAFLSSIDRARISARVQELVQRASPE